jgi:lipoate-protein ligase B
MAAPAERIVRVADLGIMEYGEALKLQHALVERVIASGDLGIILLMEHPPTVTLGKRGTDADLIVSPEELSSHGITLYRTDRGGEATYHGPGQLVCYPILSLKVMGLTVRRYVELLENTIVHALNTLGISAHTRNGRVGVWIGASEKIASIGVKIERRVAFHGFSLNVRLSHDPGRFIVSCGMPDAVMVGIGDLSASCPSMPTVKKTVIRSLADVFNMTVSEIPPLEIHPIPSG